MSGAGIVEPILLGIVEGLTEFLPVSSTGHLILASALLGYEEKQWATFNIIIQLGAILAVIVYYWRTFLAVFLGLVKLEPTSWRFLRNILIAFMPAVVIGLAVHDYIEALLLRPDVVAVALVVGGIAILAIEHFVRRGHIVGVAEVPVLRTLGIGFMQCLAMIPGVSRSGATIMGAMCMGVERRTAAEFSFFLAVPTMLGATTLEVIKNHEAILHPTASSVGVGTIAIGFGVSFIVALAVIRLFLGVVTKHGFAPFAWYRITAGVLAFCWLQL
ncbi:undecaprenyl-diphosphate phosphatase [Sphingomonas naphthae]|uniref:Undecaprenyl-diphosphatase n=1 Tax=Sphingomonas naphthae TaxID=1813468 RepID=A0ABY7TLU5_9SPHN|nr:undecaprenyl-diphosphate phosphatase [Sphingomonas naphthae]WCT74206.1 undecaprenyl-diphosphate phosphatase [Sphingomonas naphthae]